MNKKTTSTLLLLLAITILIPHLCAAQDNTSLTGKWKLFYFPYYSTHGNPSRLTDSIVKLTFKDSAMTGKFRGNSFCNAIEGQYLLKGKDSMKVTIFSGTKVACQGEGQLWDAFHHATNYKRAKDTLTIFYNDGRDKMVFVGYK
jgi:hypothetical protein